MTRETMKNLPFSDNTQIGTCCGCGAEVFTLLAMFGLEERIITSSTQHIEVLELPIDRQRTERILEQQRRSSEDFLGSYTAAQD